MKPLLKIWPPLLLAIVVSYFFIDRPLCAFIYTHAWPQHLNPFVDLAGWPPVMSGLAPFLLFAGLLLKPGRMRETLLLMALSILLAFVLKNDLKWVFSRDWPMTWIHNNPSWISNHAYGFQWFQGSMFQGNDTTGSFPSGHTAIAFATFIPLGLIYRRVLPFCIAFASLEGLAMVAYDYHFLSDVLAGAVVGITSALAMKEILESKNTR